MNEVSLAIGAYAAWSLYRDGRWLVRNWKRGVFHLGRATRALVGPSRARPRPATEPTAFQTESPQEVAFTAMPAEPPKPPSFAELKPQAALDYIMAQPKQDRGPLLAEAIRDGRLEIDPEGRPIVAGTKGKKRK